VEVAFITKATTQDNWPFLCKKENTPQAHQPLTTNEFAKACLQGREVPHLEPPFTSDKCIFLDRKAHCTIYDARPLMCRLFVSTAPCAHGGEAVVPEHLLTLSVILQQLIEHLCAGYRWGNLLCLLQNMYSKNYTEASSLRHCIKAPGFLIPPEEEAYVKHYMKILLASKGMGANERENLKVIWEKWFGGIFESTDKN